MSIKKNISRAFYKKLSGKPEGKFLPLFWAEPTVTCQAGPWLFIKKYQKQVLWLTLVAALVLAAATGYAVMPSISLNSPTSFPVDI